MSELIQRKAAALLQKLTGQYPVITVTGPRQSGKTTLCRKVFGEFGYANLEAPDTREFALEDPRGFLWKLGREAVLDEFQNAPDLVSYLQEIVDDPNFRGQYILTGSSDLTLRGTVNQSLAGRTALISLLPLSYEELSSAGIDSGIDGLILSGFYPRIHAQDLDPSMALASYVGTYLERDVRTAASIGDLTAFQRLLGLCAGRVGQLLNLTGLGNDAGLSHTTVGRWLSLLEAGYVLFRLPPFHSNVGKRLIKSPKLYFYDVGLASWLIGIRTPDQVPMHPLRGMLFESLIITEVMKHLENRGIQAPLSFYRDSNGNEIDLVIRWGNSIMLIEIKSSMTVRSEMLKGLFRFPRKVKGSITRVLVHAGEEERTQSGVLVTGLPGLKSLLNGFLEKS